MAAEADESAKAGAPETQVTPEMMSAGVLAFYRSDPRCEDMSEILAKVFIAMQAAKSLA